MHCDCKRGKPLFVDVRSTNAFMQVKPLFVDVRSTNAFMQVVEKQGVEFYTFKSFTASEEQESRKTLGLDGEKKKLKGAEVKEAQEALKELGWDIKGVSHDKAGGISLKIDSAKALSKIIGQMEEAEVGMGNVYKE